MIQLVIGCNQAQDRSLTIPYIRDISKALLVGSASACSGGFMLLSDTITTDDLKSKAAALCRKKTKAGYDHMSAFAASQWMQVNADVLR